MLVYFEDFHQKHLGDGVKFLSNLFAAFFISQGESFQRKSGCCFGYCNETRWSCQRRWSIECVSAFIYYMHGRACFHVMAHADLLLGGPEKSVLPFRRCERAICFFFRTGCKFWRENFRGDLNENKRGLGMFVGNVRTSTRPGTLYII